MDLPLDAPFGFSYANVGSERGPQHPAGLVWIDHHKSAIESHPKDIPGYRIDGVAACRLAWQWFTSNDKYDEACQTGVYPVRDRRLPAKEGYLQRQVNEPMAVRLAGEYDIWDHRGDGDVEFQFGLDSQTSVPWASILRVNSDADELTKAIVTSGTMAMQCYKKRDSEIMLSRSFTTEFEGLNFLCLNTARCNSNSFLARDNPNTGHDALLAFYWTGKAWSVSLYHANHRKDIDLSLIAVKHGGGGHKGACGFRAEKLPFLK